MASLAECEQALHDLAARLADSDSGARERASFDRTMSCTLRDLGTAFAGHFRDGALLDIRQVSREEAKRARIKLDLTSDDLVALVAGRLAMTSAWTSGRVKVDAAVRDLLKLKSIF